MSLRRIFAWYTAGFLGITILIGLAQALFGLPNRWVGWLFVGLSLAIYVVIGIITRTSNADQYYVAGRGVPAIYNGMATGSDWMSAASFISMGGALSAQGFAGLAYVMGWTGGYLLLAVFLGPYLRQFGAYTIPDFLGARYGGNTARVIGVIAAIACSFTYLIAQVTGVGLIVSRFIGLDFNVGVFVGLLGVLFCSVLGGMRSVTWTQVAQYIILIISYLVPVVYLSWQLFAIPVPELTYGQVLQENNAKAIEVTRDPKEKETRALWKQEAGEIADKIKAGGLPDAEVDKLKARMAIANRQAVAPAVSDDARFGRYLTVPSGVGMWNFLALTFCLMVGTAGLPHILTRYYTTPSVRQARTSVAWSLFFIFLLYFTAPAYAAFARFAIYAKLIGTKIADLPRWVTLWQPAGLFEVVDKNHDGIIQWADFVVKSTDFVVLAMPEIAGLPFVITGLVMAGGLAAALSTADGLLLTIANAISHDLYYNVIDPRASLAKRLTITKVRPSSSSWWRGPSAWPARPSSRLS
jgi:cation/acetate symporter